MIQEKKHIFLELTSRTLIRTADTHLQITLCSTVPLCFKFNTFRHKYAQSIEVHCAGPLFLMSSESCVRNERVSLLLALHAERNVDLAWTYIAQPPKGVPNFSV